MAQETDRAEETPGVEAPEESRFAAAARSSVDLGDAHEAFVAARKAAKNGQISSAETETPHTHAGATDGPPEPVTGESAEASGASIRKGEPKPRKTASERAKELIGEGRVEEAMKILDRASAKRVRELEDELAKSRESRPAPSAPTPTTPQPETKETSKPKRIDFTSQVGPGKKYAVLEDAEDAYDDARDAWRHAEVKRSQEAEERTKFAKSFDGKRSKAMTEGERKYDDFRQVINGDPQTGSGFLIRQDSLTALVMETDNAEDVLYAVASDPEERKRIMDLNSNPVRQAYELFKVSARLSQSNGSSPKPKPVSARPNAPPPPPVGVNGVDAQRTLSRSELLPNPNFTTEDEHARWQQRRMAERRASGRR